MYSIHPIHAIHAPLSFMPLLMGNAPILRRYSNEAMIMPVVVRPRPICSSKE